MALSLASHAESLGGASITYRPEEQFRLKSGALSNVFVDLRQGHANPERMLATGSFILDLTAGESYDTVVGTGVDGGAVVSAVILAGLARGRELSGWRGSDNLNGPSADEDLKNGWGFRRRTASTAADPNGEPIMEGRRVLAVEGTFTSGGSLRTCVDMVRQAGGLVTAAVAVVDRSAGGIAAVAQELGAHPDTGLPIHLYTLFALDEEARVFVPSGERYGGEPER